MATNLPVPAQPMVSTRPGNANIVAIKLVQLLIDAAAQGNALAKQLVDTAKANPKSLQPFEVRSVRDIPRALGTDAMALLKLLYNERKPNGDEIINDAELLEFRDAIDMDNLYYKYAAAIAPLPEYPLKYRNMVPVYNEKGQIEDIETRDPIGFQKYMNELNRLTSQEQVARRRVVTQLNNRPLNRIEQDRLFRLQHEEAIAYTLPPTERQVRLAQLVKEYADFETNLIRQQHRYFRYDKQVKKVEEISIKAREKQEQRNSASLRERDKIVSKMNVVWAGGQLKPDEVGPKLESATNAVSRTSQGSIKIGQEDEILQLSSIFDENGNIKRSAFRGGKSAEVRGAELALQYANMAETIKDHIKDGIEFQCSRFSNEDKHLIGKIAEAVGQEVAPDIAEKLQQSLTTWNGVPHANDIALMFTETLEKDATFRTRVGKRIVETMDQFDPDFGPRSDTGYQIGRVEDFLAAAMRGIKSRPPSPVEEVRIKRGLLPNRNNVLYVEKKFEIPDGRHVVRGRQEVIVSPSLLNAQNALTNTYRFRRWITDKVEKFDEFVYGERHLYGQQDTRHRQVQLAKQAAFVQGALDFEAELKKHPANLLLSSISPLGFATGTAPYIAWQLAPEGLRKASTSVKAGLIAATGFIPGVGLLGPLTGSLVGLQLAKKEFDVKYGFPILNTTDWLKAYTEGQVKQFAATLLPLAKYDNKGRLGVGLHLLPASWDIVCNFMGKTLIGKYDKNFLSLDRKAAKIYSKSFGGRFRRSLGDRWKNADKRRDPISILIFAPLNVFVKTVVAKVLEVAGMAPAMQTFLEGNELGYLTQTWRTGGGWANIEIITKMRDEAVAELLEKVRPYEKWDFKTNLNSPESKAYLEGLEKIDARFNRLYNFGKFIRGMSTFWQGGKILFEGAFRGVALGAISFLITGNPTTAALIGAGYTIPWTIREFIQTPIFGGYHYWERVGKGLQGTIGHFEPGHFQRWGWSKNWLGKFSQAYNTPLGDLRNPALKGIPRLTKWASGFGRLVPWDGMFMTVILTQIGVPWPWTLVPTGFDLVARVIRELSKTKALQIFFGPTGLWTKFTSLIAVGFNIGALTYALDTGIFEIFTRGFSIPRLMKLLTIPSTYLSFVGFFSAFPALAFGVPGLVAAGIATATVIVTDTVLRWIGNAFNIAWAQHGIWGLLKRWIVDPFWDFLKSKGFDFAAGALAAIVGLFGAISSLMKGDIQNFSISMVLLIAGGLILIPALVATTVPSSFYTPVIGAPANDYIESAYKEMTDYKVETLDGGERYQLYYEYGYKLRDFALNDISSISIIETDTLTGVTTDGIVSISSDQGIERQEEKNIFEKSETFKSAKTVDRKFVIELSDSLENLLPDSDDYLCNTIQIKIAEVRHKNGALKSFNQPYVSRKICIDRNGNPVGGILHVLPIDPNKGRITSCFECRKVKEAGLGLHFHNGVDISATQGTSVYSSGNGTVVIAGVPPKGTKEYEDYQEYYASLGVVIVISHEGKNTLYGHLSDLNVKKGDIVKAGDVIGKVGNTGVSTGPHLHYAIYEVSDSAYVANKPLNPCSEKELQLCKSYPGENCSETPLYPKDSCP